MSGASSSTKPSTTKATTSDAPTNGAPAVPKADGKPPAPVEGDDEFEDFPVEDWPDEETELGANGGAAGATAAGAGGSSHLWEESWDDDDTSDDFAKLLREELKKVDGQKK